MLQNQCKHFLVGHLFKVSVIRHKKRVQRTSCKQCSASLSLNITLIEAKQHTHVKALCRSNKRNYKKVIMLLSLSLITHIETYLLAPLSSWRTSHSRYILVQSCVWECVCMYVCVWVLKSQRWLTLYQPACILYLHTVIETHGGSTATVSCKLHLNCSFPLEQLRLWLQDNLAADKHTLQL